VIDRLAENHIDLTRTPVEVAPIAHYHMGGVKTDATMATDVPGLYAAGEVVGGANGANRLSGNAITEALVFGRRAGRSAAARAKLKARPMVRLRDAIVALDLVRSGMGDRDRVIIADMIAHLQAAMADGVGPIRTRDTLMRSRLAIVDLKGNLSAQPPGRPGAFDLERLDWFDLRNMVAVASAVATAAHARLESRGAHQREDFPEMLPQWQTHLNLKQETLGLRISGAPEGSKWWLHEQTN
jgi:succinate dehydrogenase / fumarate reductase flavoprotein subunit/fumarate reductase (CoM/CoB) subunit A